MRAEEQRIRGLQEEGRITRREADQIVAALDTLENRSRSARLRATRLRRDVTALGILKARFLTGEISRHDLNRGMARIATTAGITVACTLIAGMALLRGLDLTGSRYETWWDQLTSAAFLGGIIGLVTASATRTRLQAQVMGLARLRRKVDIARPELAAREPGCCPACGSKRRQPAWLKALVSLGWVTMPWIAINELYLGQRLPRSHDRCVPCGAIYLACPGCKTSVENLDWAAGEATGVSAGMQCKHCGSHIPCWRNGLALLIQWLLRFAVTLFGQRHQAPGTRNPRAR